MHGILKKNCCVLSGINPHEPTSHIPQKSIYPKVFVTTLSFDGSLTEQYWYYSCWSICVLSDQGRLGLLIQDSKSDTERNLSETRNCCTFPSCSHSHLFYFRCGNVSFLLYGLYFAVSRSVSPFLHHS